jgi:hypothetical protein
MTVRKYIQFTYIALGDECIKIIFTDSIKSIEVLDFRSAVIIHYSTTSKYESGRVEISLEESKISYTDLILFIQGCYGTNCLTLIGSDL